MALKLLNCLFLTTMLAFGLWMMFDAEGFLKGYGSTYDELDQAGKDFAIYIIREWWSLATLSVAFCIAAILFSHSDTAHRRLGQILILVCARYLYSDATMSSFTMNGKSVVKQEMQYFNYGLHGFFLVGYIYALYVAGDGKSKSKRN